LPLLKILLDARRREVTTALRQGSSRIAEHYAHQQQASDDSGGTSPMLLRACSCGGWCWPMIGRVPSRALMVGDGLSLGDDERLTP
jgi:hypothetical protein